MNLEKIKVLRKKAKQIFSFALKEVDAAKALKEKVTLKEEILKVGEKRYKLSSFENIYVIGAGKASAAMAQTLEEILSEKITQGIVNVKYGHSARLKRIKINEAGHPLPDSAGVKGSEEIRELVQKAKEKDLVICLLSGGGSALLPLPSERVTLSQKQVVTDLLLKSGATIEEINIIRKHLFQLKGGRLAQLVYPAPSLSLILSDVVGDRLEVIASGPTVPDSSTFSNCQEILKKYNLLKKIPSPVKKHIEKGMKGKIEETPKPGDPIFDRTYPLIVANNLQALKAAKTKAKGLGFNPLILSSFMEGETREVAKIHTALVKEILYSNHPVKRPACIISGGETTVTVRGKGLGGRNQEFALAAALNIEGLKEVAILSGGTDGTDGPTEAAGAIVDGSTLTRAKNLNLNPQFLTHLSRTYA